MGGVVAVLYNRVWQVQIDVLVNQRVEYTNDIVNSLRMFGKWVTWPVMSIHGQCTDLLLKLFLE